MGRASAGAFDKRISIWRAALVDDGTASVPGDPGLLTKRWAKKQDVSDGEKFKSGENAQELSTRWTVRSDAVTRTIGGGDIIKHKGIVYGVVGTKERQEREDVIEITTAARPDRAREV